jgi:hypothetical protein
VGKIPNFAKIIENQQNYFVDFLMILIKKKTAKKKEKMMFFQKFVVKK